MDSTTKKNTTLEYLKNAELGSTIVAFRTEIKGVARTLSGKLIARTLVGAPDLMLIETKNGSQFEVDSNDIIWVKTGDRWPRWVFEELKKK